ncbi:alpha/beta fold hydrolase [Nocardia sp. IFM 10818]
MTSPRPAVTGGISERFQTYGRLRTRALSVPGNGIPIVLLHGFANSADTWRGVLGALATANRSAVAVDMAGFGAAEPFTPGPLLPQLDAFADAVLATIGPAVLVGNSLGVAVSLRAAQRNPALVRGVVCLDEPILSDDWLARLSRSRVAPLAGALLYRAWLPTPLVRLGISVATRFLWGDPRKADRVLVAGWVEKYGRLAAVAWLADHAVRFARETVDGYPPDPITCPVRIVHGAKDRIIPVQAGRDLHRRLPSSELVVLPHAGHCPQLDDPVEIASLLTDFIDTRLSAQRDVS